MHDATFKTDGKDYESAVLKTLKVLGHYKFALAVEHEKSNPIRYARDTEASNVFAPPDYYITRTYIGALDAARNKRYSSGITIFKKGRYFDLNGRVAENEEHDFEEWDIANVNVVKLGSMDELDKHEIGISIRGSGKPLHSTNIYLGSEEVLAAYVSSKGDAFRAHDILTRLGLPISDELGTKIRNEAKNDVIAVYNLFNNKERKGHWSDEDRLAVREKLERLGSCDAARLLGGTVNLHPGVTIHLKEFISGVGADSRNGRTGRLRS